MENERVCIVMKKHTIDRRREKSIENFISDKYDLDEDMSKKIRKLIIDQYYKSTVQMSDLGFNLDRGGYKNKANYDKDLEKFQISQRIHDEYEKELKMLTEKERLTDDEISNIKEFVLGCCRKICYNLSII